MSYWLHSPFLSRSPRSAMPQQHQNWVTTAATTSSPAWYRPTPTRPRPWWTLSLRWSGTTCPRSPQRATTERAAWRPSSRSPEKLVGALPFPLIRGTFAHHCSERLIGPPAVWYIFWFARRLTFVILVWMDLVRAELRPILYQKRKRVKKQVCSVFSSSFYSGQT